MALNIEATMTDLMTSLAVVFIMLMFAFMQNQSVDVNQGSTNTLDALQTSLKQTLNPFGLECKDDPRDPLACIIRLPDDQLKFEVNRAELDPKGAQFLWRVIPPLVQSLTHGQHSNSIESVYIDGFTDSDGDDEANLLLSQQRAFSAGYHVISKVLKASPHRQQLIEWLYVNGRGENDLVTHDCTSPTPCPENKQASRRVEVKIRVQSYEQRQNVAKAMGKVVKGGA